MWFILSLISIFFWSGSDFFSKLGSLKDLFAIYLLSYLQKKREDAERKKDAGKGGG